MPSAPLAVAHPDLLRWMSAELLHARARVEAAEHELHAARVDLATTPAAVARHSDAADEAGAAAKPAPKLAGAARASEQQARDAHDAAVRGERRRRGDAG